MRGRFSHRGSKRTEEFGDRGKGITKFPNWTKWPNFFEEGFARKNISRGGTEGLKRGRALDRINKIYRIGEADGARWIPKLARDGVARGTWGVAKLLRRAANLGTRKKQLN